MARKPRPHPITYAQAWPRDGLDDVAAEKARLLALRLREKMGDLSARGVGARCGVDSTTVSAILNGTTWPDLRTIALLEDGLDASLWPTATE